MTYHDLRPNRASNKKVVSNRPTFFGKRGVCFLQLFYKRHSSVLNCNLLLHNYFMCNHSYENSLKQCKISYNLIKFCWTWEFKVSRESRDNLLYFCTVSMQVKIKSIYKSTFHFSLMSSSSAAFQPVMQQRKRKR